MRLARIALAIGLAIMFGLSLGNRGTRPREPMKRRLEGLALFEAGRFQEAIPYFDQVLARHGAISRS